MCNKPDPEHRVNGSASLPVQRVLRRHAKTLLPALCLSLLVLASDAATIVMKITAANPSSTQSKKVPIKKELPRHLQSNDVINAGGFDLKYDVKKNIFVVEREIELGPTNVVTFEIEMRDVWIIPGERLEQVRRHAAGMTEKLKPLEKGENVGTAEGYRKEIEKNIAELLDRQQRYSVEMGARAIEHVWAYERNLELYNKVMEDVAVLENLLLYERKDPGSIIGADRDAQKEKTVPPSPDDQATTVIRVSVANPSPTSNRVLTVKRDLPAEIMQQDIIDSAGLEVARDSGKGVFYVYKQAVDVPASQTVTFDVVVKDKWRVDMRWLDSLNARATNLLAAVLRAEGLGSLKEHIKKEIVGEIGSLRKDTQPETIDDKYVAFHRERVRRLELVEQRIKRLEDVLTRKKRPKLETTIDVRPPSMKATWVIVYSILGFLAVLSVLFFFRWYGKSKPEKIEEKVE